MPDVIINPFTGKQDFTGLSQSEIEALFLKLDQTTPQTVDNGSPKFNQGITIKAGQKLILDGA